MKKIFSILKKSWISILLVIILLFIQANCDLALPDYTSNIINIGIQQSGIDSNVLEAVRKSEMENIMVFSNDKEGYRTTSASNNGKHYQNVSNRRVRLV